MKYSEDIVEKLVARLASGEVSQRELERVVRVPRKTLGRWFHRKLTGQPTRFTRTAKRIWNKTIQLVLNQLRYLLKSKKSAMLAWVKLKKVCLRTVQRYNLLWFPPKPKPKLKVHRYERRHALSLMHTDWGVKRILNGKRCCFTFYEDDASRKLFALHAYPNASLVNTLDNLQKAKKKTGGFRQVLSDNGRQYHKNYDAQLHGIKHIKTRIHNPKCNGKAEAVVKKVKRFLSRYTVRSVGHANVLLSRYQREYNKTPHSGIKYQTPNQIFRKKLKSGVISAVT